MAFTTLVGFGGKGVGKQQGDVVIGLDFHATGSACSPTSVPENQIRVARDVSNSGQ